MTEGSQRCSAWTIHSQPHRLGFLGSNLQNCPAICRGLFVGVHAKHPTRPSVSLRTLFPNRQPSLKGSKTGYLRTIQVCKPSRETREQAGIKQAEARALVTLCCTENKVVKILLNQQPHHVLVPINLLLPDDFPEALFKS